MQEAGEDMDAFTERALHTDEGPKVEGSKWGGAPDIGLYTWRRAVRAVVIDADRIRPGMSKGEIGNHVHEVAWPPDDVDKTHVIFMILDKKHFLIGVTQQPKVAAIFPVGIEADATLEAILERIAKEKGEKLSNESAAKLQGEARREALMAAMRRGGRLPTIKGPKKAKKKKPKEVPHEEDEAGWQAVPGRTRKVNIRVISEAAPEDTEDCLVVYTEGTSKQMLAGLDRLDSQVRRLVYSTRQKEGHVILAARKGEAEKLKASLGRIKALGFSVAPYHTKRSTLSSASKRGLASQVHSAGVCRNYFNQTPCPFGDRCRFKCFKDLKG